MVSSVDELADNENDEKWITKAIKNAGKKAEAAALKRKSKSFVVMGRTNSISHQGYNHSASAGVPIQLQLQRPVASSWQPNRPPLGPCFACHEYGHLRSGCPKIRAAGRGPLYPLDYDDAVCVGSSVECVSLASLEDVDATMDEGLQGLGVLACVKGRLRDSYAYWRDVLQAPELTLGIIQRGCQLPLLHDPHRSIGPITCQCICISPLSQNPWRICW